MSPPLDGVNAQDRWPGRTASRTCSLCWSPQAWDGHDLAFLGCRVYTPLLVARIPGSWLVPHFSPARPQHCPHTCRRGMHGFPKCGSALVTMLLLVCAAGPSTFSRPTSSHSGDENPLEHHLALSPFSISSYLGLDTWHWLITSWGLASASVLAYLHLAQHEYMASVTSRSAVGNRP